MPCDSVLRISCENVLHLLDLNPETKYLPAVLIRIIDMSYWPGPGRLFFVVSGNLLDLGGLKVIDLELENFELKYTPFSFSVGGRTY